MVSVHPEIVVSSPFALFKVPEVVIAVTSLPFDPAATLAFGNCFGILSGILLCSLVSGCNVSNVSGILFFMHFKTCGPVDGVRYLTREPSLFRRGFFFFTPRGWCFFGEVQKRTEDRKVFFFGRGV